MKYLVLLISILLTNVNDNYCTCPALGNTEKETANEFNNSELVLIGEVTRVNSKDFKYEFIVCEVFKGDLKENMKLEGVNPRTCNPIVDENGQWLLFGELTEKNKFVHNDCGLTNSLIKPWKNLPMTLSPRSQKTHKEKIKTWKDETLKITDKQLELLRKLEN
ncbi:hypothetical protein [Gillisia sp. CAL575]|uniref:hypothetical protein n=1 Tax=Gillisia sp. CAL575 TaxID=985255 RepID=UPI00039EF959|nr:hypothetical protein [Gillisia sp. CAL575]